MRHSAKALHVILHAGGPLCLGLAFAACSRAPSGSGPAQAFPNGRYVRHDLRCAATGRPLQYEVPEQRIALEDFSPTTEVAIEVMGDRARLTFDSQDCHLETHRRVGWNAEGRFALTQDVEHTWTPEDCAFPVEASGRELILSAASRPWSEDRLDEEPILDLVFEVLPDEDTAAAPRAWTWRTEDQDPVRQAWSTYGCQDTDMLIITWSEVIPE